MIYLPALNPFNNHFNFITLSLKNFKVYWIKCMLMLKLFHDSIGCSIINCNEYLSDAMKKILSLDLV